MDERDPYAPPRAELPHSAPDRGAPLNALLIGFLIVFAGTSVASSVLRLATLLGAVQMRFDHQQLAIALRVSTFALGCAAALAGGFVCARIAGRRELALGALLGALAIAFGWLVLRDGQFVAVAFGLVLCGSVIGRMVNARYRS